MQIDTTRMHELAGRTTVPWREGMRRMAQALHPDSGGVSPAVRFERCDPEEPPASELLAAMRAELNDVYETFSRLDNPPLAPDGAARRRAGAYLVGYEGATAVAGGGLRRLDDGVAEIKRMYVRPGPAPRRGRALLARSRTARELGYDGPPRHRAQAGARPGAVPLGGVRGGPAYNDNPFACFWGRRSV